MSNITLDANTQVHTTAMLPVAPPQTAETKLNVFELVKADHQYVEDLYTAYSSSSDVMHKRHIAQLMIRELSVHPVAEENSWYKMLNEKLKITGNKLKKHAMEEHQEIKKTLDKLDSMEIVNKEFDRQMTEVMKATRHHVEEEEKNVIPPLQEHCSEEEMKQMKLDWFAAKASAPTRPHPYAPVSDIGAKIAGAVMAPLDALKDKMRFGSTDKNEQQKEENAAVVSGPATKFQQ